MPRRTPVKELVEEIPLRRSARISCNSPVPATITTRRRSGSESAPKTRRLSFTRESSIESIDLKKETGKSTTEKAKPSIASKTITYTISEEDENESIPISQTNSPIAGEKSETLGARTRTRSSSEPLEIIESSQDTRKGPLTRRRSSLIEENDQEQPKRVLRSRRSSLSKINEIDEELKPVTRRRRSSSVNDVEQEPTIPLKLSPSIDSLEVKQKGKDINEKESPVKSREVTPIKKKKTTDVIDLDLSIINETSITEDTVEVDLKDVEKPVKLDQSIKASPAKKKNDHASPIRRSLRLTSNDKEKDSIDQCEIIDLTIETVNEDVDHDVGSTPEKILKLDPLIIDNEDEKKSNKKETVNESFSDSSFNLQLSTSILKTSSQESIEETDKKKDLNNSKISNTSSNKENMSPCSVLLTPVNIPTPKSDKKREHKIIIDNKEASDEDDEIELELFMDESVQIVPEVNLSKENNIKDGDNPLSENDKEQSFSEPMEVEDFPSDYEVSVSEKTFGGTSVPSKNVSRKSDSLSKNVNKDENATDVTNHLLEEEQANENKNTLEISKESSELIKEFDGEENSLSNNEKSSINEEELLETPDITKTKTKKFNLSLSKKDKSRKSDLSISEDDKNRSEEENAVIVKTAIVNELTNEKNDETVTSKVLNKTEDTVEEHIENLIESDNNKVNEVTGSQEKTELNSKTSEDIVSKLDDVLSELEGDMLTKKESITNDDKDLSKEQIELSLTEKQNNLNDEKTSNYLEKLDGISPEKVKGISPMKRFISNSSDVYNVLVDETKSKTDLHLGKDQLSNKNSDTEHNSENNELVNESKSKELENDIIKIVKSPNKNDSQNNVETFQISSEESKSIRRKGSETLTDSNLSSNEKDDFEIQLNQNQLSNDDLNNEETDNEKDSIDKNAHESDKLVGEGEKSIDEIIESINEDGNQDNLDESQKEHSEEVKQIKSMKRKRSNSSDNSILLDKRKENSHLQTDDNRLSKEQSLNNEENIDAENELEEIKNDDQVSKRICTYLDKDDNKKIDDLLENCSDDEDEEADYIRRSNDFVDDLAEEGEEDTPSEDSNQIIEEGEEINTTESQISSNDSYQNDSFIDDDEICELLSGDEYDLGDDKKKKSSRIIELDSNSDEDIVIINKKETKKDQFKEKKRSRIIAPEESSDEEIINIENDSTENKKDIEEEINISKDCKQTNDESAIEIDYENSIEKVEKDGDEIDRIENVNNIEAGNQSTESRSSHRKSSTITILENIRVDEIQNKSLADHINKVISLVCSDVNNKSEISVNLSLDCFDDKSPDLSDSLNNKEDTNKIQTNKQIRKSKSNELNNTFTVENEIEEVFKQRLPETDVSKSVIETTTDISSSEKKKKLKKKKNKSFNVTLLDEVFYDSCEEKSEEITEHEKNKNKKNENLLLNEIINDEENKSKKKKSKKAKELQTSIQSLQNESLHTEENKNSKKKKKHELAVKPSVNDEESKTEKKKKKHETSIQLSQNEVIDNEKNKLKKTKKQKKSQKESIDILDIMEPVESCSMQQEDSSFNKKKNKKRKLGQDEINKNKINEIGNQQQKIVNKNKKSKQVQVKITESKPILKSKKQLSEIEQVQNVENVQFKKKKLINQEVSQSNKKRKLYLDDNIDSLQLAEKKREKRQKVDNSELLSDNVSDENKKIKKKKRAQSNQVDSLRVEMMGILSKNNIITDLKNRERRPVQKKIREVDGWIVAHANFIPSLKNSQATCQLNAQPSTRENKLGLGIETMHYKDFKNRMLYDDSRNKRIPTKKMMKKMEQ